MNSILSRLKKTKKLESASLSPIPSEPSSSSVAEPSNSALPEFVIAVDFGTTFSGFACVRTSDPKLEIIDNCIWPGGPRAGAASYCKNQTSLYYVPKRSADGRLHLELKEWGWSAFLAYEKAVTGFTSSHFPSQSLHGCSGHSIASRSSPVTADPIHASETLAMDVGFFAHKFKLHLASQEHSRSLPGLPGDLTPEKLVVDYLCCLTKYTIEQLRIAIRDDFSMKNVQWCLSVPAIWDEKAKQSMRLFSEKAGMIKGDLCPNNDEASPYPLQIILEPEAASAYCQDWARRNVPIFQGDKILIADIGGGTIDIAVHEVREINAASGITKVKEAESSYGALGGGTFVDHLFFQLVKRKIECFSDFCLNSNQSLGLELFSWWQRIKADYNGGDYSAEYYLINSGLADAWRRHDREKGIQKADIEYNRLDLGSADFAQIFDPEVHKVIHLIEQQIGNVKILMVVGGFAASPYLKKRIRDAFKSRVKEIIIPLDPGRAICRGGASLYMKRGYIESRISRWTYGICARRDYQVGDPDELVEIDDDGKRKCNRTFSVFVKKGKEVEVGSMEKRIYYPAFHHQPKIKFDLYSSPRTDPRYTTEADAKKEGSFEVDISRGKSKGKEREIEVTMVFGDSLITVSAARKNFGKSKAEQCLKVHFDRS